MIMADYVSLNVLGESKQLLQEYAQKNNLVPAKHELHCSLIVSEVAGPVVLYTNYKFHPVVDKLHVFDTDGDQVLVLLLSSKMIHARHKQLVSCGLIHKQLEFHPHITLGVNFQGDVDKLPMINFPIVLGDEFGELG